MRIAILTAGRFHVCDLARELDALGQDVAFYSLVPPWRTRRFGLPDHCNRWLGPYLAPVYAVSRALLRTRFATSANRLICTALDAVAGRVIGPCDVLIGMSSFSLATIDRVRRRFGAHTLVERGSQHIVSQRDIMAIVAAGGAGNKTVPEWAVARELGEYARADRIVVPSKQAEDSFVAHGIDRAKLFRNPYGVDLEMFPATSGPPPDAPPTIIMVGKWSYRKGCDVLVDAWRRLPDRRTRLLHVGPVGDAPLPSDANFEHRESVDQRSLTHCYAESDVIALASREEGLALVVAQALASGLHAVASDSTGAADLRELLDDPRAVEVVRTGDAAAFTDALGRQLVRARRHAGVRDALGAARQQLTWRAYGERYDAMLRQL